MKNTLLLFFCLFSLLLFSENININSNPFSVNVLSSSDTETIIEYTLGNFARQPIEINGEIYYKLSLAKEANSFEKGAPALPFITRSLIIPDDALMNVTILESEYVEYTLPIVPSKGILSREVNPEDVPYEFSEVYNQDSFYPETAALLGEPYIMRDLRGITVTAQPFAYNPVTNTLRVYTHLILEVKAVGSDTRNVKYRSSERKLNAYFNQIYRNHFLNYSNNLRYETVEEQGRMIVISYPGFTDAVAPYVEWKNQKGIPCQLVTTNDTGTSYTNIKNFIQNQYNLDDGLVFVQLVGDAAQIPACNNDEDPSYSLLEGSDSYPDIFVGRFSGTIDAHIETQVERTIHYERDIYSGTWLAKGFGIASDDGYGYGDDSEYDWEHLRNIRSHLYDYTYEDIDEFYEGSQGGGDAIGNPNSAMVSASLNEGRGIGNYTGHGSTSSWSTSGLNTSSVNALVNDSMLPFVHSVACVVGSFINNTCFAETCLRATNNSTGAPTGAIAHYGSTINQSWSPPMRAQDHSIDLLVGYNYSSGSAIAQKYTIGGLWFNGSCNMMDVYGASGVNEFKHWTIFGDASLMVRTAEPAAMTITHNAEILTGDNTFTVNTDLEDALVCLYDGSQIIASGYTPASGNVTLSLDPVPDTPQDFTLTITAFNKITYQETIPVINAAGANVTIESYSVTSGEDDIIDPSETAYLSVTLHNSGSETAANVNMTISETNSYITLQDSSHFFGSINSGSSILQNDAFSFSVAENIPDEYAITLNCSIICDESNWNYEILIIPPP